jgi:PST family polysaccharide transporter
VKNFREKTLAGIAWTTLTQVGSQVSLFVISAILANLLEIEDFGLIGMMMVFLGFARLINEFGFGSSLVQAKEINDSHLSSTFFLNLAIGVGTTVLVWFSAPLIAEFYKEPKLVDLTRWMSFSFVIGSFAIVQRASLLRNMEYDKLAIVELSSVFVAGAVAICLALFGWGPHALVVQFLVSSLIVNCVLWTMSSWRPSTRHFSIASVSELFGFSAGLFGANTFNFLVRNSDNLLIGKFLGTNALGVYSRAYSTMLLPVRQIGAVLTRVMFPAFSRIQDDQTKIKRVYLKILSSISMFTFPAMLGLCVVAPEFVIAFYGEKWMPVIPVLRVLCLVGMVQSINTTVGWIYASQGRTDLQFYWTLLCGALTVPLFVVGLRWGILGVAIAYAIRVYGTLYFNFSIPGKLIDLHAYEVFQAIAPQFVCATTMAILVFLFSWALPSYLHPFFRFAMLVVAGVTIYSLILKLGKLGAAEDTIRLIRQVRSPAQVK